ncbi:uncharacterized protein BX663DRAFT_519477 [Cokeromyces recurvatus]|uniref:uncharacterized protein n=1 Tax=Cokeromyces recurvatus TaxID=90255 RepID=UPI00221FB6AE|nr:uncharacterized protein BX663DRAFT_519477 [Cokeromyces recurvatus]KAI7900058.1 hypothetical protein BX663DRAFT_519477 [Cokeromyces recurvatus]
MSHNFEDDLYNIYNRGGEENAYNDEDLYGDDPVVEDKDGSVNESESFGLNEQQFESTQQQQHSNDKLDEFNQSQQQQQQKKSYQRQQQYYQTGGANWVYNPFLYQQYMAMYQRNLQQQMAFSPYQMFQNNTRPYMSQPTGNMNNNEKMADDESDEGKIFVGGLSWDTTDESLRQYFSQFGEVVKCTIMRDPMTQRSKGYAFLTMSDKSAVENIMNQDQHYLDGKKIDPKKAISREEQEKTEKIFVGGISPEVTEEEFRNFFAQFGTVLNATLIMERDTGRPRGFGFVTFQSSEDVDEVLKNPNLSIKDKTIDIRRATPKGKQNRITTNFRPSVFVPNMTYYNNMPSPSNYRRQDNTRATTDNKRNPKERYNGGASYPSPQSRNPQHYRPY